VALLGLPTSAQQKKPNILILCGDDIGYWRVNAYHQGTMGCRLKYWQFGRYEGISFSRIFQRKK
jgi:arylsulfatase A-like enzyme